MLLAEGGVEGGAGGQHAGYFAANDLFGELGVLHLIADGDAVALAQQAREVGFDGVVGNAAHGLRALPVARRQGQLQLAADGDGVVVEELVEVAHAEEEQGIGVFALGCGPLAHEGRQFGRTLLQRERVWIARRDLVQSGSAGSAGLELVSNHAAFQLNASGRPASVCSCALLRWTLGSERFC